MANYEKIRQEYITSNISLRKIADKYKAPRNTVMRIANKEMWAKERDEYRAKLRANIQQKTLNSETDVQTDINTMASKIRLELMNRIYEMLVSMPKVNGTRSYQQKTVSDKKSGTQQVQSVEYNLRDLVASYKDLQRAVDEKTASAGTEDDPLLEILKRWDKASGVSSESETT